MKEPKIYNTKYPPPNTNGKVLWIKNTMAYPVQGMHDKPMALCRWFVREHQNDSDYAGGKLVAVGVYDEAFKQVSSSSN